MPVGRSEPLPFLPERRTNGEQARFAGSSHHGAPREPCRDAERLKDQALHASSDNEWDPDAGEARSRRVAMRMP